MSTATTPSPDLRPLGIGELIDRSASLWRRDFGTYFRLYLGVQLGVFILGKLFELASMRYFPLLRGGAKMVTALQEDPMEVVRQYAIGMSALFVLAFLSVWISWLVGVAGSRYAIRRQLGEAASLKDGFGRVRARLGTITGAFILSTLWGIGLLVLSMVPGGLLIGLGVASASASSSAAGSVGGGIAALFGSLLMLLGMGVTGVWWVLRFLLTAQVIAVEEVGAVDALRRSGELVSGRVGPGFLNLVKVRATILLTIIFVILIVVGLLTGLPATLVTLSYANPLDPMSANPDATPQALLIPAQLLQVIAQAAFTPLYVVVGALFYLDMRIRREGLDLELQLARASGRAAA